MTPTAKSQKIEELQQSAIATAKKITDCVNSDRLTCDDSAVQEAVHEFKAELASQAADTSTKIKRRNNGQR